MWVFDRHKIFRSSPAPGAVAWKRKSTRCHEARAAQTSESPRGYFFTLSSESLTSNLPFVGKFRDTVFEADREAFMINVR